MLSIWLCSLWLWFLFLYFQINYLFDKYHFLKHTKKMASHNLPAFSRHDYAFWNKCSMICTGFFLAPIRIMIILNSILLIFIQLKILTYVYWVEDFSEAQSPGFVKLSKLTLRFYCRIILFMFGYWRLPKEKVKASKLNYPGLKLLPEKKKAMIVSNHVTFIDIFYFLSQEKQGCFISNALVKDYPLVGMIAQIIQCVFVERTSKESRAKCFDDLRKRVRVIDKRPDCRDYKFSKL